MDSNDDDGKTLHREVSMLETRNFANQHNLIYVETSAFDIESVQRAFNVMIGRLDSFGLYTVLSRRNSRKHIPGKTGASCCRTTLCAAASASDEEDEHDSTSEDETSTSTTTATTVNEPCFTPLSYCVPGKEQCGDNNAMPLSSCLLL